TADYGRPGRLGPPAAQQDDTLMIGAPAPPQGRRLWVLESGNPLGRDVPVPHQLDTTSCDALVQPAKPILGVGDLDGDGRDEVVAIDGIPMSMGMMTPGTFPAFRSGWARMNSDGKLECHALTNLNGAFFPTSVQISHVHG